MKTFLVTGAAGFIGGAVAAKLIADGHEVVTVDNLSTGFRSAIPAGVKFIQGDCQDKKIIDKLHHYKFDAIFHIAGQSSGEISFDDPVYDLHTNTQSTLLLLDLALKTGCTNFIYASTMSVYGDKPDVPVQEDTILQTKSFYGVGKIASEHYLRIYQEFGINSTALRLFNVYGPGQNMENLRQGMVSIFLAQALQKKHIHVKGSPDRYRDLIYIDDVVNAFLSAYEKEASGFNVCNISTGLKTRVGGLVTLLISNLSYKVSVEYSGGTPGDQHGITGNNSRAKQLLDWHPETDLATGLKKMVKWASS